MRSDEELSKLVDQLGDFSRLSTAEMARRFFEAVEVRGDLTGDELSRLHLIFEERLVKAVKKQKGPLDDAADE
jgi:hypothetical protein